MRPKPPPLRSLRVLAPGLCLGLVLLGSGGTGPEAGPEAAGTVYLVRHGETEGGDGPDQGLSAVGWARAEALAERLADARIEAIYTTDYRRTRETAAPLAARLELEPRLYDPNDLAGFAARLREALPEAGGTVLVVGHSNTTPELVGLLGGEPGSPIAEDEHDRLYRVGLPSGATEVSLFGPEGAEPAPQEPLRPPAVTGPRTGG